MVNLLQTHPELAAQLADPTIATMLTHGSGRKVHWRCDRGHLWASTVDGRKRAGCPMCSGHKPIPGETDLATTHPEIARQLVDQSLATKLKAGSEASVRWRCGRGHQWYMRPRVMTRGGGCRRCRTMP